MNSSHNISYRNVVKRGFLFCKGRPVFSPKHLASAFLGAGIFLGLSVSAGAQTGECRTVREIPAARVGSEYVCNREPLLPSRLIKLPIGSITPRGWLRKQLELEAKGMTGRLAEISPWLKFEESAWASPDGEGRNGWEELPYWLKGYGDLGYVLQDKTVIAEARKWIDAVLASQDADGYFGPRSNRTGLEGKPDLWPHMVMLNVLQSFYEYSADPRVLPFLLQYHRWLNSLPPESFGAGFWPKVRFGDNVETAYWLYNRTGEAWLLDLAKKIHDNMARWDTDVIDWHNVNIAQGFREPAEFYLQAGDDKYLQAAERNYRKVMDTYGQFPGGGFVGDENIRSEYTDPRGGLETCGWVEFMHSFELLTRISGIPIWADRCEEIDFNSFPAAMTPDLKGLHYITSANQVQLDKNNKSPGIQNGGTMFSYSPSAAYRCCQHNVSHGWPYYAEELWLATADGGLCASLYAASDVSAKVGDGSTVKISEETDYPFGETIALTISTAKPVRFPLYLRIPQWCSTPSIKVNGKPLGFQGEPLSYAVIHREWKDGDTVSLTLPMQVSVRRWAKNGNSASVEYGPLAFSLKIGEQWSPYNDTNWPSWEVFPTTDWNYGLVLDESNPAKSFSLTRKSGPLAAQPFTPETAPLELTAKARKIPAWQQDSTALVGKLQVSPIRSDEPVETVTLIPMGCARLRISAFPVIGSGPDATTWQEDPTAWSKQMRISVSRLNEGENTDGLRANEVPANSNDQKIRRMTWWNHKGTLEWVQYDFPEQKTLATSDVYWFDDTGEGECRVPESWRLLYKDGEEWKPVETSDPYGVNVDTFNHVAFTPVQTSALRLEAQLQKNFSGGLLAWKVTEK